MTRRGAVLGFFVLLFATSVAFAGEWTGQVVNKDGKLWFKSGDNAYQITNPEKATDHEGQIVKIVGTANPAKKSVTIKSVSESK